MSILLAPLSLLYRMGQSLHRGMVARKKLDRPVISIGNITWGGTGKTPMVIRLAGDLIARGRKVAILSRGYKSRTKNSVPRVVSDGTALIASPAEAGDEPCLIASRVPGAIVMAGADRYRAGSDAIARFSPDIFILDDGFQHWALERNYNIVCVNALNPFGNGCLIPAGILREDLTSLERADLVIVTNSNVVREKYREETERGIRRHYAGPMLRAQYAVGAFRRLSDGRRFSLSEFGEREIAVFSGLGENRGVQALLEKLEMTIVHRFDFRDHYWYNIQDVRDLLDRLPDTLPLLTTEKDAMKLKAVLPLLSNEDAARIYAIEVDLKILPGESSWEKVVERILQFS